MARLGLYSLRASYPPPIADPQAYRGIDWVCALAQDIRDIPNVGLDLKRAKLTNKMKSIFSNNQLQDKYNLIYVEESTLEHLPGAPFVSPEDVPIEDLKWEMQDRIMIFFAEVTAVAPTIATPKQYEAFNLYTLEDEDRTQWDVADILGVTQSAVHQRIKGIRKKPEKQLAHMGKVMQFDVLLGVPYKNGNPEAEHVKAIIKSRLANRQGGFVQRLLIYIYEQRPDLVRHLARILYLKTELHNMGAL